MKVIAVINHKGGVGKTTTAVNLGAGLSRLGRSVLLADLDPQSGLTASLAASVTESDRPGLSALLTGAAGFEDCALPAGKMVLLPADPELADVDADPRRFAAGSQDAALLLKRALGGAARRFDYAILDCPPNLGFLTYNALAAAHLALIPLQAEYLALNSVARLRETLEVARATNNPDLADPLFLAVRYNRRRTLNREVLGTLKKHFPGQVLAAQVRDSVALAEAPGFGLDIFSYRPKSAGAEDYLAVSREIDARMGA